MRVLNLARASIAGLMMTGGLAVAAPAGGPILAAIARLEPGQWQIKPTGSTDAGRLMCLSDVTVLIQYGHGGNQCQHFVIANLPDTATVHYACPGTGHGRTTFKVATPRAFDLETQGIINGAPFEESYEAHRVGACPAGSSVTR